MHLLKRNGRGTAVDNLGKQHLGMWLDRSVGLCAFLVRDSVGVLRSCGLNARLVQNTEAST